MRKGKWPKTAVNAFRLPKLPSLTGNRENFGTDYRWNRGRWIQCRRCEAGQIRSRLAKIDFLCCRGGSTLGQGGHVPQDSLVAPRFKSWLSVLTWFLRSTNAPIAPKSKFSGALPRTPLGELTALPRPSSWWGPHPALGPSVLVSIRVSGSNPLHSWQPY